MLDLVAFEGVELCGLVLKLASDAAKPFDKYCEMTLIIPVFMDVVLKCICAVRGQSLSTSSQMSL